MCVSPWTEGTIHDQDERGVIPRAAFDVFRRLADDSYVEHAVSASFLEIYNEELCDLLLAETSSMRTQHVFRAQLKV